MHGVAVMICNASLRFALIDSNREHHSAIKPEIQGTKGQNRKILILRSARKFASHYNREHHSAIKPEIQGTKGQNRKRLHRRK